MAWHGTAWLWHELGHGTDWHGLGHCTAWTGSDWALRGLHGMAWTGTDWARRSTTCLRLKVLLPQHLPGRGGGGGGVWRRAHVGQQRLVLRRFDKRHCATGDADDAGRRERLPTPEAKLLR